jgi:uncharacterized protein (TIGR02172 family)
MSIDIKNDNGQVVLTFEGRMETSFVQQITDKVFTLLAEQEVITELICDVHGLSYISSSGLRLILQLAKQYENFRVIGAGPEVYQVFDITGFTQMIKIERAMRSLSVAGCEMIGRGGVGVVYRLGEDTIIKVFRKGTTMQEVQSEISLSKDAFVLGMPTAISFDIVRVGECYGLVYELLNAETLSSCIKREPERMEEFARMYAELFQRLHDIHVPEGGRIPSALEREKEALRHISKYFDAASVDLLLEVVYAIPASDRLLHCDLQTKNVMKQGDELMLIDMGEISYGHPMLDLGHAYSAMVTLLGDYESIIGMPKEYGRQLWDYFMTYYFEGASPELLAHRREQLDVIGTVRNFSWLAMSDSFPESVIRECQQAFSERVIKRKDYIRDICRTFGDWK